MIFKTIRDFFKPEKQIEKKEPEESVSSTDLKNVRGMKKAALNQWLKANLFQKTYADIHQVSEKGVAMDSKAMDSKAMDSDAIKSAFAPQLSNLPQVLFSWYVQQSFIGYQACAIIAQNWLVNKACTIPAKDAIKKDYKITVNDGSKIDDQVINTLRQADKRFKIKQNLIQFEKFNRVFGIRIALFKFKNVTDDFYIKPFNLDGIKKNSYQGIAQLDPYWITPELDESSVADPSSVDFYEPTWWRVDGKRYHKSHLIIARYSEISDILKPSYIYGGLPIPQLIMERVYAAERTANEAPLLALTKRLNIIKTDTKKALAKQDEFKERLELFNEFRDNHGTLAIDKEEDFQQADTTLTDLDALIMTQYQLVASIAGVPATRLIETSPKGFSSTGEFEESSYYDNLEGIQEDSYTPLLERHYQLLIRSEGITPFEFDMIWEPLDSPTAKELAEINELESRNDNLLQEAGAIDGGEVRDRIIANENSGYNGLKSFRFAEEEENGLLDKSIKENSLNGAQVTSLMEVVNRVRDNEISRESAMVILTTSFPINEAQASRILGDEKTDE